MQDELNASTAIEDGIVAVPDGGAGGPGSAGGVGGDPIGNNSSLPTNTPRSDLTGVPLGREPNVRPPATGPPEGELPDDRDYWYGLIDEKTAADFLGMTPRWMQAKRQHGGGAKFCRISPRCIRYTRYWLKTYADERLRLSTSDDGEAADA